ncbi:MAG: fumarylacetoacetate hydrolase family protein [Solirubrobacterales bacterium]
MRLASFRTEAGPTWGLVRGDELIDAGPQLGRQLPTLRAALAAGALVEVGRRLAGDRATHRLDEVELLPPIVDPAKILCAGVNYPLHRLEGGLDPVGPDNPTVFTRFADSQVGDGAPIARPPGIRELDYEGEIAVVIGAPAYRVAAAEAPRFVAGYAAYNDISVREFQRHTSQWTPGKNFLGLGAFGPWLVTPDEIGPEDSLVLTTRVNGEVVQEARLGEAIFSVAELLEYVTSFTPLAPGDVLVTGTPDGVGLATERFLEPGDVVEVEVGGVGVVRNPIVEGS